MVQYFRALVGRKKHLGEEQLNFTVFKRRHLKYYMHFFFPENQAFMREDSLLYSNKKNNLKN